MDENKPVFSGNNMEAEQNRKDTSQKSSKASFLHNNKMVIMSLLCCVIFICISTYTFFDAIYKGADEAINTFSDSVEDASEEVENEFYEWGLNYGESSHHVKNIVSISLGRICEKMELEVLQVYDVGYIPFSNNDEKNIFEKIRASISRQYPNNIVSWLNVSASGSFTVDMRASEFIIDNNRQYVLIRVPKPRLSNYHLNEDQIESLNFHDGGLVKDSATVGQDIAQRHLQYAEGLLKSKAFSNQYYYSQACENTQTILRTLIKQFNPKLPNLTVEIEFL